MVLATLISSPRSSAARSKSLRLGSGPFRNSCVWGLTPKRNLSLGIALAIPTGELRLLQPRIEIIGSKLPMDDWSSSSGRRYLSGNVLRTDGVQPVASAALPAT